jgi:hypothetical protein
MNENKFENNTGSISNKPQIQIEKSVNLIKKMNHENNLSNNYTKQMNLSKMSKLELLSKC